MKWSSQKGGYFGLLGLMIGGAILIFIMFNAYLSPSTSVSDLQPTNARGVAPTTQYERNKKTIDKVNDIANQQAEKATETNNLIDSIK